MPLTGQQQVSLYRALCAIRPDWDEAGTHKHVEQLGNDPREARLLALQAFTAAADSGHRTPLTILTPVSSEAVVRTITPTPPRHDDPVCVVHKSSIKDVRGRYICCVQEAAEQRTTRPVSPAPPARRCGPPPAEIKDRIERDFQARRAARAREGAQR